MQVSRKEQQQNPHQTTTFDPSTMEKNDVGETLLAVVTAETTFAPETATELTDSFQSSLRWFHAI